MKIFVAILGLLALSSAPVSAKRVVCYFSSWAVYRQGEGKFQVEDIDPNLCTHLIYAFISVTPEGVAKLNDEWNDVGDDWHEGLFTKFERLKAQNPNLKTMLAVGGWNHGPAPFQSVVRDPAKRAVFIETSMKMLKDYKFDGLDIDWEYQDSTGGTDEDRTGFSALLREMSATYHANGYLLSAATSANFNLIEVCYELPALSQSLDFINVMAYDLHGSWDKVTGNCAPLYPRSTETGDATHLNVEAVINRYIERGADPSKINLGIPVYGRTFTLADANQHGVGATTYGPGEAGEIVPEGGSIAWAEVCTGPKQNTWSETWDDDQHFPYAIKGMEWAGYDNLKSLQEKLAWAKGKGIGGVMLWSIETDDHKDRCGLGKYSFINTVNQNWN